MLHLSESMIRRITSNLLLLLFNFCWFWWLKIIIPPLSTQVTEQLLRYSCCLSVQRCCYCVSVGWPLHAAPEKEAAQKLSEWKSSKRRIFFSQEASSGSDLCCCLTSDGICRLPGPERVFLTTHWLHDTVMYLQAALQ